MLPAKRGKIWELESQMNFMTDILVPTKLPHFQAWIIQNTQLWFADQLEMGNQVFLNWRATEIRQKIHLAGNIESLGNGIKLIINPSAVIKLTQSNLMMNYTSIVPDPTSFASQYFIIEHSERIPLIYLNKIAFFLTSPSNNYMHDAPVWNNNNNNNIYNCLYLRLLFSNVKSARN